MTSTKNRERILEAIDQLRRRKARPDIQRICNYLFRRFSVSSVEAKNDLEWCVANNFVLKVEYKGNISYRNAAKKFAQMRQRGDQSKRAQQQNGKRDKSDGTDKAINSKAIRQFNELLTDAFGQLIVQEPDYIVIGIPTNMVIDNIFSKDSVRYTKKYISLLIEQEVSRGGLIKTPNGSLLMGPAEDEEKEKNDSWGSNDSIGQIERDATNRKTVKVIKRVEGENNRSDSDYGQIKTKKGFIHDQNKMLKYDSMEIIDSYNSGDEKKSDNGSLRIGGRRKRARKVFDPSDNHVPKKRGRPIGSLNRSTIEKQMAKLNEDNIKDSRPSSVGRDQGGVCSVCHVQNKRGPNDRMVGCRECSNKAHLSCLNSDDNMMLKMYPDNTWQCPHCKTCVVCFETSNSGFLTVCSVCADAYHAECHQPRINEKLRNGQKWLCSHCSMPDELKMNEIGNSFGQKHSLIEGRYVTPSNSGNSTPSNFDSPPLSPKAPRLSPQTVVTRDDESKGSNEQSDSHSKDSDYEDSNIDPSIPDATHWTPDDVYRYFAQYFPDEAKIFKEQEIDGRSLLLLKRIDVLTNLNLKLGPALKIYRHVVKLQVRRDDPKLYWL